MENIIILVQTHEHAAQLAEAGRVVGRLGCQGVWVCLSPSITVTEAALQKVTAEFDKEVQSMKDGEAAAIRVRDYKTAEDYKGRADAAFLNRKTAVRNAWKGIAEEDRRKEGARHNITFLKAANPNNVRHEGWKVSLFAEHFDPTEWIPMLNEQKSNWPVGMPPGEFAVMWPKQLVQLGEKMAAQPIPSHHMTLADLSDPGTGPTARPREWNIDTVVANAGKSPGHQQPNPVLPVRGITVSQTREQQLRSMKFFALKKLAADMGIPTDIRSKSPQIIAAILAKEAQPAVGAAA